MKKSEPVKTNSKPKTTTPATTTKAQSNPVAAKLGTQGKAGTTNIVNKATATNTTGASKVNSEQKYVDPEDIHVGSSPKFMQKDQLQFLRKILIQAFEEGKPMPNQAYNSHTQQYFKKRIIQKYGENIKFNICHLKIYNKTKTDLVAVENGEPFIVSINKYPNAMFQFWRPK